MKIINVSVIALALFFGACNGAKTEKNESSSDSLSVNQDTNTKEVLDSVSDVVQEKAQEAVNNTSQTIDETKDKASREIEKGKENVNELYQKGKQEVSKAVDETKNTVKEAKKEVKKEIDKSK